MERKHHFIAAITISCLSLILVRVGLATSRWITGCVDSKVMKSFLSADEYFPSRSPKICISYSLFETSLFSSGFDISIGLNFFAMDVFIQAVIILLVSGLCFTAIAIFLLAISIYAARKKRYDKMFTDHPCFKPGFLSLLLGVMCFGAGILSYTVPHVDLIHDSHAFFLQIAKDFPEEINFFNHQTQPDNENLDVSNPAGNPAEIIDSFGSEEFEETDCNDSQKKNLQTLLVFLRFLDPNFGFSFFVTWIGFILSLFSLIFMSRLAIKVNN